MLSPVGFAVSPVESLHLGLTPEKFRKFQIFPGESTIPRSDTETGCPELLVVRQTCNV